MVIVGMQMEIALAVVTPFAPKAKIKDGTVIYAQENAIKVVVEMAVGVVEVVVPDHVLIGITDMETVEMIAGLITRQIVKTGVAYGQQRPRVNITNLEILPATLHVGVRV